MGKGISALTLSLALPTIWEEHGREHFQDWFAGIQHVECPDF